MEITKEQILEIMPNAKDVVALYLPYINGYKEVFKIDTPLRMAHFLAQIAHESNELRNVKEIGSPSYFEKYDTGKLKKMLGNLKPGDGYKYRGRGLIQITGRANYMAPEQSTLQGRYHNAPRAVGEASRSSQVCDVVLGDSWVERTCRQRFRARCNEENQWQYKRTGKQEDLSCEGKGSIKHIAYGKQEE